MTDEIPKNGLFTDFYANSQMKSRGNYKDGKKDGKWDTWFKNGQKQCKGEYEDGYEVGNWIWWAESGHKIFEGDYKDGKVLLEKKLQETEYTQTHLGKDIPNNNREMKSNNENKGTQAVKIKETKTVKISDIDMPFGSMVVFMVKWAIASIPAILILMVLFFIFGGLLGILT